MIFLRWSIPTMTGLSIVPGLNSATSLAMYYYRQTDQHPDDWINAWNAANDPFCWPHLGTHLWDGEASIAFGDGHVEKSSFYDHQRRVRSWNRSGRDCEWYMDADGGYKPMNFSALYQPMAGH